MSQRAHDSGTRGRLVDPLVASDLSLDGEIEFAPSTVLVSRVRDEMENDASPGGAEAALARQRQNDPDTPADDRIMLTIRLTRDGGVATR